MKRLLRSQPAEAPHAPSAGYEPAWNAKAFLASMLSCVAVLLIISNWYPFFAGAALSKELVISSASAVRALAASIVAWTLIYNTCLFILPTAAVTRSWRTPLRTLTAGLPLAAVMAGLTCLAAHPYLISSPSATSSEALSMYRTLTTYHIPEVGYALEIAVIPAAAAIAATTALSGTTVTQALKAAPEAIIKVAIVAILAHDILEPLANAAITYTLLHTGGAPAALPYYRGYGPLTLKYLATALTTAKTLTPPTWGTIAGLTTYALTTAATLKNAVAEINEALTYIK